MCLKKCSVFFNKIIIILVVLETVEIKYVPLNVISFLKLADYSYIET